MAETARRSASSGPSDPRSSDGGAMSLVHQSLRRGDERQTALEGAPHEHAGNQQPIDLVRALEDAVHARVAIVALGRIVPARTRCRRESARSRRARSRASRCSRPSGSTIRSRTLRARPGQVSGVVAVPAAARPSRPAVRYSIASIGVLPRDHVAELLLDRAERGDRLAELTPLRGVARRFRDGRASRRRCTSRPASAVRSSAC